MTPRPGPGSAADRPSRGWCRSPAQPRPARLLRDLPGRRRPDRRRPGHHRRKLGRARLVP